MTTKPSTTRGIAIGLGIAIAGAALAGAAVTTGSAPTYALTQSMDGQTAYVWSIDRSGTATFVSKQAAPGSTTRSGNAAWTDSLELAPDATRDLVEKMLKEHGLDADGMQWDIKTDENGNTKVTGSKTTRHSESSGSKSSASESASSSSSSKSSSNNGKPTSESSSSSSSSKSKDGRSI